MGSTLFRGVPQLAKLRRARIDPPSPRGGRRARRARLESCQQRSYADGGVLQQPRGAGLLRPRPRPASPEHRRGLQPARHALRRRQLPFCMEPRRLTGCAAARAACPAEGGAERKRLRPRPAAPDASGDEPGRRAAARVSCSGSSPRWPCRASPRRGSARGHVADHDCTTECAYECECVDCVPKTHSARTHVDVHDTVRANDCMNARRSLHTQRDPRGHLGETMPTSAIWIH